METYFQSKENQGRQLFIDFFTKHPELDIDPDCVTFTKGQYDSTDVTYWSGWSQTQAEIKTRDYLHTQTWFGLPDGWIFEKTKFDELKAIQATANTRSTFINIFRDSIVIWDLTRVTNVNWIEKLCWETHEKKRKVLKKVCYPSIKEATHIFKHNFEFHNHKV